MRDLARATCMVLAASVVSTSDDVLLRVTTMNRLASKRK
jgi:hypothetical protein